jgi:hemolysin III
VNEALVHRSLAMIRCEDFVEEIKPLLRGWSHAAAAIAAIGVTIALLLVSAHDIPRFLSLLVYGVSLVVLYIVSAVYHVGNWSGRWERFLLAFDHANIFLLIAGSYTPIVVNVLSGWIRTVFLALIWAFAAIGIAGATMTLRAPRWLLTVLYVGMGWASVLLLPEIARALPIEATILLLGGGLLYTAGAVIYIFGRPNPLPRVFGFHELFHLCVVAGSAAVAVVIWFWVVPFPRA